MHIHGVEFIDEMGHERRDLIGEDNFFIGEDPVGHRDQQGQTKRRKDRRQNHEKDRHPKNLGMTAGELQKLQIIVHRGANVTIAVDFCRGVC